jgi:hypothetical protein
MSVWLDVIDGVDRVVGRLDIGQILSYRSGGTALGVPTMSHCVGAIPTSTTTSLVVGTPAMSESDSDLDARYGSSTLRARLGPLGLLPSFAVSEDTREKLTKLEQFPLDREVRLLTEDETFTLPDRGVPTIAREFKRFMSLGLLFPEPKYNFAPSRPVDRIWHELILDTKRYYRMCMEAYGRFIHHNPLDPEEIVKNAGEVMTYTKECMVAAYGGPVPWAWGAARGGYYTSHCDQSACW